MPLVHIPYHYDYCLFYVYILKFSHLYLFLVHTLSCIYFVTLRVYIEFSTVRLQFSRVKSIFFSLNFSFFEVKKDSSSSSSFVWHGMGRKQEEIFLKGKEGDLSVVPHTFLKIETFRPKNSSESDASQLHTFLRLSPS